MFRNAAQCALVVRSLLAKVDLADLWTANGPTDRAIALRQRTKRRHGRGSKTKQGESHTQAKTVPPDDKEASHAPRDREIKGERYVMVLAAWSVWTVWERRAGRHVSLRDLLAEAPPPCRLALGELLIAMACEPPARWKMIDDWIGRWAVQR